MSRQTHHAASYRRELSPRSLHPYESVFFLSLVLVFSGILSGCANSSTLSGNNSPIAGNWQFQLETDGTFASRDSLNCPQANGSTFFCAGGFLTESGGAVTGQLQYAIIVPPTPTTTSVDCNSGSAQVTGSVNGLNVTLTALAGPETFSLKGAINPDGSMGGNYSSDGKGCGNPQSPQARWTATLIPPMTGIIQGTLHSTGTLANTSTQGLDIPVSGFLVQAPNTGASSGSVSGTLNFQGYPCLTTASVNGQVSGTSAILQLIPANGVTAGQIGSPPVITPAGGSTIKPAKFANVTPGGPVLQGGYGVSAGPCKANGPILGDAGNICLAVGGGTACNQPITLSPASLTFPIQFVGSPAASQAITLTNTDPLGATLNLQISFTDPQSIQHAQPFQSDFDGVLQFSEQDNCAGSFGASFSLTPQQSCTITVSFSPHQSCPWSPNDSSSVEIAPRALCPPFLAASVGSPPALNALLQVTCSNCRTDLDNNTAFAVPVKGLGLSAIQPSVPELDFGAEQAANSDGTGGETSAPQSVTFTNQGLSPIEILPSAGVAPVCSFPRPPVAGLVPGFQVVMNLPFAPAAPPSPTTPVTPSARCDRDPVSLLPNFQIVSNSCAGGALLQPQQSCELAITYAPQPGALNGGLDYFIQLNTVECTSPVTANCEIDSGRLPVELKTNPASPLRMSPGAGLDFGIQARHQMSAPLSIIVTNDAQGPSPTPVTFTGNTVQGDFAETDDCLPSLAPGASCTVKVTFMPTTAGYEQGRIMINYTIPGQTVFIPQTIYLRGTGQ